MEISNTELATVKELDEFSSTVSLIPDATEVFIDSKIEPIEGTLDSALNAIDGGLEVGLSGLYAGIFNTQIWYFKKGDIVDVNYGKGGGYPQMLSDKEFQALKEKYPNQPVSQPTVTNNPLTIPPGQIIFAYIQSSNLTKIVSYKVTVDFWIDNPPLTTPIGLTSDYKIEDYPEPPFGVLRSEFVIKQTVNGDLLTAKKVINSYYGNNP